MSEIDDSTLVESALEMQPLEEQPAATIDVTTEAAIAAVSNQEAMTALTLGRVKKQSKQIENVTRLLAQVPVQFRNFEKKQSRQAKQLSQQIRAVQNQVRLLQKQVARIKISSNSSGKRKVARKAKKSKSRRR